MKKVVFIDTEGILDSIRHKLKMLPEINLVISEKDIGKKITIVLDSLTTN